MKLVHIESIHIFRLENSPPHLKYVLTEFKKLNMMWEYLLFLNFWTGPKILKSYWETIDSLLHRFGEVRSHKVINLYRAFWAFWYILSTFAAPNLIIDKFLICEKSLNRFYILWYWIYKEDKPMKNRLELILPQRYCRPFSFFPFLQKKRQKRAEHTKFTKLTYIILTRNLINYLLEAIFCINFFFLPK